MNPGRLFIFLAISCMVTACPEKAPRSKNVKSINGEVVYIYSHDGKKLQGVYKDEPSVPGITVAINNDSIRLEDEFEGRIYVLDPNHKIEIIEPSRQTYISTAADPNRFKYYRFKPERAGEYGFTGTITYDSVSYDFQYFFYVKGRNE